MIRECTLALAGACSMLFCGHAAAQVTFYEGESYRGRVFTTQREVTDLERSGSQHRGASAIVEGGYWEACEEAGFKGRCVVLRRGSYAFMVGMGLERPVGSVRPVGERPYYDNEAPPSLTYPTYEYRRRPKEPVFEAPVTSVRAVVGIGSERCSMEEASWREARRDESGAGEATALDGTILGHQSGAGDSRVPRCSAPSIEAPEYWDVSYTFRGARHRMQVSARPGTTIAVNARGEPRG